MACSLFRRSLKARAVEILGEMVRLRRLLILTDPTDPATPRLTGDVERVARQLKVELVERRATTEADLTKIFAALKKGAVDGMVIISPKLITNFPAQILRLSLEAPIVVGRVWKSIRSGRKKIVAGRIFDPGATVNVIIVPGILWDFFE